MGNKLHRHKCKSFREFKKLTRKYLRHLLPLHMRKGKVYHKQYDKWRMYYRYLDIFEYDITTLEELKTVVLFRTDIVKDVIEKFGNIWKSGDKTLKLIGLCIGTSDMYYIYETNDGEKKYGTAVGSIDSEAEFILDKYY